MDIGYYSEESYTWRNPNAFVNPQTDVVYVQPGREKEFVYN